jgi:ribonuclease D
VGLTISKESITELPREAFSGTIKVIEREEDVAEAAAYLSAQSVIGFDTETKPSFQRGVINKVALMQLAAKDVCFLFRLNKIGYPKPLEDILCNPDIKKIGLSLRDDFAKIRGRSGRNPENFIDLQVFVDKFAIDDNSLQRIYAIIFGKKITKNQRLSNWEAPALTHAQQAYAALDAWACLRIYNYLMNGE